MKIRVYYEDTDCGGIVYHSRYFNFCERARSELFFEKDLFLQDIDSNFVVSKIDNAIFKKSSKLGDLLSIKTEVILRNRFFLVLKQIVYRDNEEIFSMEVKLVYIKNSKISSIPKNLIEIF